MSLTNRVTTILARLKCSSLREIFYRIQQQTTVYSFALYSRIARGALNAPPVSRHHLDWLELPEPGGEVDPAHVKKILVGERFCLNEDLRAIEHFERRWDNHFYWRVRSGPGDPDIRCVWEPARLQHLLVLLHACGTGCHSPKTGDGTPDSGAFWPCGSDYLNTSQGTDQNLEQVSGSDTDRNATAQLSQKAANKIEPQRHRVHREGNGLATNLYRISTDPALVVVQKNEGELDSGSRPQACRDKLRRNDGRGLTGGAEEDNGRAEEVTDSTCREEIEAFVREELMRWLGRNPFLKGPHYMYAIECASRIVVFLHALKKLEKLGRSEQRFLIQAIYEHGWLIRSRLSLFSSLGNHTLAECVGLVLAGGLFLESAGGRDWLQRGIRLLEQESFHQILDDGGPVEQSLNYHRLVLDLYWVAVDYLEKNRLHDCSTMVARLEQGERFFSSFGGPMPAIGDSDDGNALAPGLFPRRHLEMKLPGAPCNDLQIHTFPRTGYTVIHSARKARITFDHGPLGMAPLYNHGHADALSITLYAGATPFLVDPGTYCYNREPDFRAYFKGTSAHNTVAVDGLDQARQVTGFIWDRPYQVHGYQKGFGSNGVRLAATHDGYARLPDPVHHTREIFVQEDGLCVIRDTFSGTGIHIFDIHYHLHPDVKVCGSREQGWVVLESCGVHIGLKICDVDLRVVCGQHNPLLGWYSPSYGVLQETAVLYARLEGNPSEVHFTTLIALGG